MFATIDLTRATLAVLAIAAACSVRVQAPGELAEAERVMGGGHHLDRCRRIDLVVIRDPRTQGQRADAQAAAAQ